VFELRVASDSDGGLDSLVLSRVENTIPRSEPYIVRINARAVLN